MRSEETRRITLRPLETNTLAAVECGFFRSSPPPPFPVLLTDALIDCSGWIVFLRRPHSRRPPRFTPERLRLTRVNGGLAFCCCRSVLCAGGDKQGRAASKQPAESQPSLSAAAAGTGDGKAQRKETVRRLAAKVPQVTHTRTHTHVCIPMHVRTLNYKVPSHSRPHLELDEKINTTLAAKYEAEAWRELAHFSIMTGDTKLPQRSNYHIVSCFFNLYKRHITHQIIVFWKKSVDCDCWSQCWSCLKPVYSLETTTQHWFAKNKSVFIVVYEKNFPQHQ